MSGLASLVADASVVAVVGSGGVGKTSVSAACGLAAAQHGRRVCVVTVDPARRLADALGGADLGPDPRPVAGRVPGELWAMMLDSKATFDRLVRDQANSPRQADEILANAFYQRLSTSTAGIHEYMAVEQLHSLATDARFDLVVVDTPPSQHVLDLVDAPGRLARFLDNRMYRTLVKPASGVARIAAAPARALTRRIAAAVGGQILDDALGFFEAFAGMESGFVERAREVEARLVDPSTAFVAVATPRRDSVDTAISVGSELASRSISLRGTVANMVTGDPWPQVEPVADTAPALPELQLRLDALRDRHRRAEAELESLAPLRALAQVHASVARQPVEVADVAGLRRLGQALWD